MDPSPLPTNVLQQQALPLPAIVPETGPARVPKHFLAAFFLSFFLGVFGADRFYLGKYVSGVVKLLTFGLFGIGAIVDLALIMNGAMRDSHDRPLIGYEEYRGLAKRMVLWVTIGIAVFVLINAILLVVAVQQALQSFDPASLSGLGGGSTTDTTSIQNLLAP